MKKFILCVGLIVLSLYAQARKEWDIRDVGYGNNENDFKGWCVCYSKFLRPSREVGMTTEQQCTMACNEYDAEDVAWGEREDALREREKELQRFKISQPATQGEKVSTELKNQGAITGSSTPPGKKANTEKKEKVNATKKTTDK